MPERRVKIGLPGGQMADGSEVPIKESSEKWSEYTLEDGTIIRVKTVVSEIIRIDNQYDAEGNPTYAIKSTPAVSIIEVPEKLKKKKH